MKNKSFNAEFEISEIREWLARKSNRQLLLDGPLAESIALLRSGELDLQTVTQPACKLDSQCVWWTSCFLDHVYSGNRESLITGARMMDCLFYRYRILAETIEVPGGRARVSYPGIYLCFLLLLTFSRWNQAMWLGNWLYKSNESAARWQDNGIDISGWKDTPFCGFVLRLWLVLNGQIMPDQPTLELPDCGPYNGLFSHWLQPDGLAASIAEACNYHVRRSVEVGEYKYDVTEFHREPYNVLPVEILALRQVRRRMGLDTPFPPHPLLDSPFVSNLPDELPPSDDPHLKDVLAAAGKVLPGLLSANPLSNSPLETTCIEPPEPLTSAGAKPVPPPSPPTANLQRTETTTGHLWWTRRKVFLQHNIRSAELAATSGMDLFRQIEREHAARRHLDEIEIIVTGEPEHLCKTYNAFLGCSSQNARVEEWILNGVPHISMSFETPDGDLVRDFTYWTENGKRMRAEMKPTD